LNNFKLHITLIVLLAITGFVNASNTDSIVTYTIPGATVQPQWVFPLWFEDGDGRRDTVYICYDSLSGGFWNGNTWINTDTVFGEKLITADTNKFNMDFKGGWDCLNIDTLCKIQKVQVSQKNGNELFDYFSLRSIRRVKMPIKMKWDATILNSDSLPFIIGNNKHKAQGQALFNSNGSTFPYLFCPTSYYLLMSDSNLFIENSCTAKDSIVWSTGTTGLNYFFDVTIRIQKWTGALNSLREIYSDNNVLVVNYNGKLIVKLKTEGLTQLKMFDVNGKVVYQNPIINKNFEFNSIQFTNSLYNLQFSGNNKLISKKIIINN